MVEYVVIFLLTIAIVQLIIKYASVLKLLDNPKDRSMHSFVKPRGAGLAIFLSFIVTMVIFQREFFLENIVFSLSVGLVFVAGLIDDIIGVKPKIKFLFITIAIVVLFFYDDFKIDFLGYWANMALTLSLFPSLVFTIFAIVGFTNAFNLIDGLDGLSGSIALVILSSFFYIGYVNHDVFIINITLSLSTAIVAFLFFNWYPSKIFLGDSGALFIGFVIGILAIKVIKYSEVTTILYFTAIPIIDTLTVMIKRILEKKSPFEADKTHIHHIVYDRFKSVWKSTLFLIVLQVLFCILGFFLQKQSNVFNLALFVFLFSAYSSYRINSKE